MPEQSYVALRVLFDEVAWVLTCFDEVAWVLTCFAPIRYSRMHKGRGRCRSGIELVSLPLEYQKLINRHLLNRQTDARRAQIRAEQNDELL